MSLSCEVKHLIHMFVVIKLRRQEIKSSMGKPSCSGSYFNSSNNATFEGAYTCARPTPKGEHNHLGPRTWPLCIAYNAHKKTLN